MIVWTPCLRTYHIQNTEMYVEYPDLNKYMFYFYFLFPLIF